MKRLEGRAAIVTGAARGMGRATVIRLADEGAIVGAADLTLQSVQDVASEVNGIPLQMDVSDLASVRTGFETFLASSDGQLDILVNCAGTVDTTPIPEISPESWDRVFDVNLRGTFLCCQAALESMKEGSSIINIGSQAGLIGSTTSGAGYAATKAGVVCLTKTLAKFGAPRNIRVNVINPGYIDTPMHDSFEPEVRKGMVNYVPLKRLGRPEEIAAVVAFLASDDASFMTGSSLNVNGGSYMGS
ncbi:MAG: SDR family NAD(P)-dependent oxidoreductase [Chloroflexota bacterium]|nr:MAG: hypothetical protein DLM70_05660 [Chloroflexota bacterium]